MNTYSLISIPKYYSTYFLWQQLSNLSKATYSFFLIDNTPVSKEMISRFISVAEDSGADFLYSDYRKLNKYTRQLINNPLCDYQAGSLRDDFDFGKIIMVKSDIIERVKNELYSSYKYAAFYALRLAISRVANIVRINEFLYTIYEDDERLSGEKQFDYVNPRNRNVQLEMELACTEHLKKIGAYISSSEANKYLEKEEFVNEASIIIPVFNRVKTIKDALISALNQKTDFKYNVIVVDNHSTDGTSEIISKINSDNLIHIIPSMYDLGIGGCWNLAINYTECGKYVVQLDSDDVYSDENTLQKIVDKFRVEKCAMVVGSYEMKNFELETLPPGIIDHREWTDENGRNNALRINGLGAPRAFYTPVIREIRFPNTSYGEDYSVGLRISRDYRIGRIYDVLYFCRRWEGNSDSNLNILKQNEYNTYKDRLRTWEISARIKKNLLNKK